MSLFPERSQMAIVLKISDNLYVLSKQKNGRTVYSPLAVHSFLFLRPKKLTDAEKFNIQYPNPAMLTTTADKLRYYRYKKSLLQREVAEYAGINESTYIHYENPEHDYYPIDKLSQIAELLEVDITDLLDKYNRFFKTVRVLTDTKDSQRHGIDTVSIRKTVWRKRRSSKTMGKWKSEGDKRDVGEFEFRKIML